MLSRKYEIISTLVLILLLLRLTLLFTTFNVVVCEEGAIGIFAKHILEHNYQQPLFDYFQPHQGGHVVVGLLSVPFFWLFRVTTFSLRIVPLLFSIGTLLLLFYLLDRLFNRKVAVLASFLYIFSPPPATFNGLYCFASMGTNLFFNILLVRIFFTIFFGKGGHFSSKKYEYFMLLGLTSGFAAYFYFSTLIVLVSIILFWYIFDKLFFVRKQFFVFLFSFTIGIFWHFYYILSHWSDFLRDPRYNPFIYLRISGPLKLNLFDRLSQTVNLFSHQLIESFGFDFYGQIPVGHLGNHFYYFLFFFAYIFLLWDEKGSLRNIVRGIVPLKRFDVKPEKISQESFFITFPFVYAIVCFFNERTTGLWPDLWPARYFFPLFQFLYIVIALSLVKTMGYKNIMWRFLSVIVLISCVIICVWGNLSLIGRHDRQAMVNLKGIISFLQTRGINYVYTYYNSKWPLVFESKERIITSSKGICNCDAACKELFEDDKYGMQYFEYARMVEGAIDKGLEYGYVFNKSSDRMKHYLLLEDYLKENHIEFRVATIKPDYIIYYHFSKVTKPDNIKFAERWKQRKLLK